LAVVAEEVEVAAADANLSGQLEFGLSRALRPLPAVSRHCAHW
jgi:hypothetical protein